jgi:hypothetical protein
MDVVYRKAHRDAVETHARVADELALDEGRLVGRRAHQGEAKKDKGRGKTHSS